MIHDVLLNSSGNRQHVINHVLRHKLRVIDVGGATSFAKDYLEAVADFNDPKFEVPMFFKGNINLPGIWGELLKYVAEKGKFDFAICTHTLEDICNPMLTISMLPMIAKAGYIAMPSKYTEFSRLGDSYRGFIHHLHIYEVINGVLRGYPKVNYIEDPIFDSLGNQEVNLSRNELSFWWDDTLPFKMVNDGFLGPTTEAVKGYYQQLLDK